MWLHVCYHYISTGKILKSSNYINQQHIFQIPNMKKNRVSTIIVFVKRIPQGKKSPELVMESWIFLCKRN